MALWHEMYRFVKPLRGACARSATFCWLFATLVAMCACPDGMGVSGLVRSGGLAGRCYVRLLHLFNGKGLRLNKLTSLWLQMVGRTFTPVRIGKYRAFVADGINVPKEGRKMPAVKLLHNASDNNSKPEFMMGHSYQAISMLAEKGNCQIAVPLLSRICEGLVESNRSSLTLLDKMVQLFNERIAPEFDGFNLLIADAYYASSKVIKGLRQSGTQLISRCKGNAVAYEQPKASRAGTRGRPRLYGKKVHLRKLFDKKSLFTTLEMPIYNEANTKLLVCVKDLIWGPLGEEVRFVAVIHPRRGRVVLMSTDKTLSAEEIIRAYSLRFKIESGFKSAKHVVRAYAYRFWSRQMDVIKRRSKGQYLHRKPQAYREAMKQKLRAYHLFVQLGCIAQGTLQYLSFYHTDQVWRHFRSWLRTLRQDLYPSEQVVATALSSSIPEFLMVRHQGHETAKILASEMAPERFPGFVMGQKLCA